ncbi:hypothetical protein [Haliscomenobacter sp.]|uniref:hypothetical protein n=1 Tax=Haliscomenobacter sp. TaxID=2717303 RepID=UPI003BAC9955
MKEQQINSAKQALLGTAIGDAFGNKSMTMDLKLVKGLDLRKNDTILESTTCGSAAKTSVAFRPQEAF